VHPQLALEATTRTHRNDRTDLPPTRTAS